MKVVPRFFALRNGLVFCYLSTFEEEEIWLLFKLKKKCFLQAVNLLLQTKLVPCYHVEGSLFPLPKTFKVFDEEEHLISQIEKKVLSFLPKFNVTLANGNHFTIKKDFSFLKSHYTIEDLDMEVKGNFWDMDFQLLKDNQVIANISQQWFRMTSTYQVEVYNETYNDLTISLVIAIDYVKELEKNASN